MKFSKTVPHDDGYYYFIDIEYPIPQMAYIYRQKNNYFIQRIGKVDEQMTEGCLKYYRFGPKIPLPTCEEISYDD